MARTLRALEQHEDGVLRAYTKHVGEAFAGGEPLAMFDVDGKPVPLTSDAPGVFLRELVKAKLRVAEGAPIAIVGDAGEDIGWHPQQVEPVRMLILRRCPECGNDYPVNGLVDRAQCTRCGDVQRQPVAFWKSYLLDDVTKARKASEGAGGQTLAGNFGACTRQAFGLPALCRKCYALVPWSRIANAWNDLQHGPVMIECESCTEPHRLRLPPPWVHEVFPDLVMLFGETAALETSPTDAPKPVVFKCPSCMAALKIAGERRIVHCEFCDSDLYLPDDLWLHFNPASKRARW